MSETATSTTDDHIEPADAGNTTEPSASPTTPVDPAAPKDTAGEAEPKRTVGLRKPTGPARGAMAATAMAAVPATGVVGSIVYGNFGPAGLAATAATGLAAGGVALAVRAKRRAEERAAAKSEKSPALPPHSLGGLGRLLGGAKEKAARKRAEMAERRAARGTQAGAAGAGRRLRDAVGAATGRGRPTAGGGVAGRGRAVAGGATSGRAAGGQRPTAGRGVAGGRHGMAGAGRVAGGRGAGAGRPAGSRGSAAGSRGAAGRRPTGGGRAAGHAGAGGARYVNPATGRPMSAAQVASAIRRQQRTQRVVNGNSYPRQMARWAARHPKAVGLAAAGIGGLAAAVVFAPLAAAAAVGLGVFGASRHPAFRNAAFVAARGVGRHIRIGRWLRGQRDLWRRRRAAAAPLDGELLDEPLVDEPRRDSEPVDADVVEAPRGELRAPRPEPTQATSPHAPRTSQRDAAASEDTMSDPTEFGFHLVLDPTVAAAEQVVIDAVRRAAYEKQLAWRAHLRQLDAARRQPRLITVGNSSDTSTEEKTMTHPFETANEALADVNFTPESGAHAEAAVDAIPGVLSAVASSIRAVLASIAEQLPQAADSLEHLNGIADAVDGISSQADEQVAGWKSTANWVWQGQD